MGRVGSGHRKWTHGQLCLEVGRHGTVRHTGTSLASVQTIPTLISETYRTAISQEKYRTQCISSCLTTSAITLSHGAWFPTENAPEIVCWTCTTWTRWRSSQRVLDSIAWFRNNTPGAGERHKGKGEKYGSEERRIEMGKEWVRKWANEWQLSLQLTSVIYC